MQVGAYLERLGIAAPAPDAEGLAALQLAHLRAVPFENLSIHRGEPIVLDEEALFEKVVVRRRGGFCYELNGLFAALLAALGYRVSRLAARVYGADGRLGIPFDHMTLRVELEEPWLADVGFGDSSERPLRLGERGPQDGGRRSYRLSEEGGALTLLESEGDGSFRPQYAFTGEAHPLAAFEGGCHYHQTSPDSHFTRKRIVSRATPDGRVTLSDRRLIVTRLGERSEVELESESAVDLALREHFGIVFEDGGARG